MKQKASIRAVTSGAVWVYMESILTQAVSFVVSMILARLIAPENYGTIALVMIFISLADVFVGNGLGMAVIQKSDPDNVDYSTALITGLFLSLALYLALYLSAPAIGGFFETADLIPVLRVMSLRVILASVGTIQNAYVAKQLKFRLSFVAGFGSAVISSVVGIYLAYKGFGVWALVTQQLVSGVANVIILAIVSRWRLPLVFSIERLRPLFSFGWKVLFTHLSDVLYSKLNGLIIGKIYSPTDLAYYNRGDQIPMMIVGNVNQTIMRVLFPVLSDEQSNLATIKNGSKRAIKTSTFIMSPLLIGLAVCAKPFVTLLLTEKWLGSVVYIQILCAVYLGMPINSINQLAMNAIGRSDIFLKIGLIKKVMGIFTLVFAILLFDGPIAIGMASLFSAPATILINVHPNKKLIDYGLAEQMKDVAPSFVLGALMGFVVFLIGLIPMPIGASLLLQILVGAFAYIVPAMLLKLDEYEYCLRLFASIWTGRVRRI